MTALVEALRALDLKPGMPFRIRVDDQEIEIRVVSSGPPMTRFEQNKKIDDEEPTDEGWEVYSGGLNMPPSPDALKVIAKVVESIFPQPYISDESDLAPEECPFILPLTFQKN